MKHTAGIIIALLLGSATVRCTAQAAPDSPPQESSPASHSIWVDKSQQRLYAFEGDRLVMEAACSTAAHHVHWAPGEEKYLTPSTPLGHYRIFEKTPDHFSRTYEVHMRYALFYDGGRAIHATYPSEYHLLGSPASGGCVRLTRTKALSLYEWARVGDPVHIVWGLPAGVQGLIPQTHPPVLVAQRPRPQLRTVYVLRNTQLPPVLLVPELSVQMIYSPQYNHQTVRSAREQAMEPAAPTLD